MLTRSNPGLRGKALKRYRKTARGRADERLLRLNPGLRRPAPLSRIHTRRRNPATNSYKRTIITKYSGPTDTRGSKITASTGGDRITIPFSYAAQDGGHAQAAETLLRKMGWTGNLIGGWIENSKGQTGEMAWVFVGK